MEKKYGSRSWRRGVFLYIEHFSYLLLDCMPPFIRNWIFRICCKEYGKKNYLDYKIYIRFPWKVRIGNGVSINRDTKIFASHFASETEIVFGDNVTVAPGVSIFSATHDHAGLDLPDIAASVHVSDDVWIGGEAIILPGVTLGKGCIVGAGSVVNDSVPDYSIVAGNPARIVGYRTIS
tara:strand:+ start:2577 stop:3110 length:534 start_codon:yes stop_codon:yes gene_type:complete